MSDPGETTPPVRDLNMPQGPAGPLVPLPTWAAIACPRTEAHELGLECETCGGLGSVRVPLEALREWKP